MLPSMRERKRYLVYEIIAEKPIKDFSLIQKQLWHNFHQFVGEWGVAQMGLWILPERFNYKTQRGIMRIKHTAANMAKAALLFVENIDKEPVIVRSVAVSGTIKKAATYLGG